MDDVLRGNKSYRPQSPEDDDRDPDISVGHRTPSACPSTYSSSRSPSQSRSPRHDGGVLNLDTKATKVSTAADENEVTAFGKPSPKSKEPNEFLSRMEESFAQDHGASSSSSRKSKKGTETNADHPEAEENGYANDALEAHHHAVRSRKAAQKDDPVVEYYAAAAAVAAAKDKPLSLVPKSMEQLELLKGHLHIPKYSNLEPGVVPPLSLGLPRPLDLYRPEIPPYFMPHYIPPGNEAFVSALNAFGYPHHLLFSMPDSSKDARPLSPPRASPPKGPPFYPPRVDPSHPSQSSAVAPIR